MKALFKRHALCGLMLVCGVFVSSAASAQGIIVGLVQDESGAVLPGVTVEAASPALIEKVKTVITDDQGRYRIVDLRPGVYKLTFTLAGFGTYTRDALNLSADQTLTINADMKVGSLEETITVSGQASQVDVQQASRTTNITRDIIDTLPVSRNVMSIGVLAPGVRQSSTPDIGGSRMTEQVGLRAHGLGGVDGEQLVEGMSIQSLEGASQSYFDDMLQSEISVMTAAIPADTSGGGIRLNSILKDGGNQISGSVFIGGTDGDWQSDNVNQELRDRGIQSANGVAHVQQFTGSLGGPLVRDKVWWFVAARHQSSDETVANVPQQFVAPNGDVLRGIASNYVRGPSLRLTWQANQKNKIAMFAQRWWKRKGLDFTAGTDPRAATQRDPINAHHYVGNMKWTSPITNKVLIEAGYATAAFHWLGSGAPGTVVSTPFTPQWYAMARRTDTARNKNFNCAYPEGCTAWIYNGLDERQENTRNTLGFSVAYVTGSHNLKFGVQQEFGPDGRKGSMNADLVENYVNGVPSTVTVNNTPYIAPGRIATDAGIYAQDSWTIKRLTVNPGVRVEWFEATVEEASMAAGRFAPTRFYPEKSLINWGPTYAPRLSAAYDLFGDGRTALKVSYSKYYRQYDADPFMPYADAGRVTENRNWFDVDLVPGTAGTRSGIAKPTDNDGIAQDNEIGTGTATFGTKALRTAGDFQRQYNWEFTTGVQHQVRSNLAVGAMLYKRTVYDIALADRSLITTSDYTSFQLPTPDFSNDKTLTGLIDPTALITVYNLNSAKRTVYGAPIVDRSSSQDRSFYTGFETSFNARLAGGNTLGGSWTFEHNLSNFCELDDNPNGINTSDLYQGTGVSAGGRFCDQTKFDIPFYHEFKLYGTYSMPYGLDFGAVMQSYPGAERVITWQPAASQFPGGARTNTETIFLNEPGTVFQPRWNQLDVNFKKNIRQGNKLLTFQVDVFNVLNGNAVFTTNDSVGASLGQPTRILLGRMPRLAFQMKF